MTGKRRWIAAGVLLAGAGLLTLPATDYYYKASWGDGCGRCHEIRPNVDKWQSSTHRKINCTECHASSLGGNVRRVAAHFGGNVPEQIHLQTADVTAMMTKCQGCHRQEFAQWSSGPHSTTYARIFLDPEHNRKRHLMDDCFRCHGMHFEGGISALVTPLGTQGPWRLRDEKLANVPAIPCLACHSIHSEGDPMRKRERGLAARQEIARPSLSLMDRRSRMHVGVKYLALPVMLDGTRPVKLSPDSRQGLCYQCHAPLATRQTGSGDDRTPVGVHEGLSCLACHQKHGQMTRASCADCHPRLSNCGLDVEKMDTTFLTKSSSHNIHFVKCEDCHTKGVPKRRRERQARADSLSLKPGVVIP